VTRAGALALVAAVLLAACAFGRGGEGARSVADLPGAERVAVGVADGHRLEAAVFRPPGDAGAARRPVVIVLHGGDGFQRLYADLARELASAGFVAVAGCWHEGQAPGLRNVDRPLDCPNAPPYADVAGPTEAMRALIAAARSLPGVAGDRWAVVGNSIGARAALELGSQDGAALPAAVVAVSAQFAGIQALPRVPTLMLQGRRPEAQIARLVAVDQYEARLSASGVPVERHDLEAGYSFLAVDPVARTEATEATKTFLRRHLAT
jgi:dienelactone hydrolase